MTLEKDERRMLVDERCLDLARHFLQDEECRTDGDDLRLAEALQRAMEDWFDARNCPHDTWTEPAAVDALRKELCIPASSQEPMLELARTLERQCASQAREIAELKLQNSIAVAAHFQECQLSEKLHKEVFELTGRLTEAAQTVASQAERIVELERDKESYRNTANQLAERVAKAEAELAASGGKL